MTYSKIFRTGVFVVAWSLTSCGGSSGGGSSRNNSTQGAPVTAVHFAAKSFPTIGTSTGNTISIGVNDTTQCAGRGHSILNLPCVTVTICSISNPTDCQSINNILLDTGSYGLRVFQSVINSTVLSGLVPVSNGANQLGECVVYGDGSSDWGPVEYAYVQLGGEPKVGIPIQVINSNFQTPPALCQTPNSIPETAPVNFNGILGVGYLAQDCGSYCNTNTDGGGYFTCLNGSCNSGASTSSYGGASVELGAQVINPVAALPTDNNGVIVSLPAVGPNGAASVTGTLTLGIGTSSTVPNTPKIFPLQSSAQINTVPFQNQIGVIGMFGSGFTSSQSSWLPTFFDTGSTLSFFNDNSISQCTSSQFQTLYCPATTTSETFTISSSKTGTVTSSPVMSVANAQNLVNNNPSAWVFSNMAASLGSTSNLSNCIDLGLPFFFGQNIFVGILGKSAPAIGASGAYFGL